MLQQVLTPHSAGLAGFIGCAVFGTEKAFPSLSSESWEMVPKRSPSLAFCRVLSFQSIYAFDLVPLSPVYCPSFLNHSL